MKRAAVLLSLVTLAIVGGTLWGYFSLQGRQRAFFRAVSSGQLRRLLDLMAPAAAAQVDPPLVASWMQLVDRELGPYEGLNANGWWVEPRLHRGRLLLITTGTARFARGAAEVTLTYAGGQLQDFQLQSEAVTAAALARIRPRTAFYKARAERFVRLLFEGHTDSAYAMLHPRLKEELSLAELRSSAHLLVQTWGALRQVEVLSEQYVDKVPATLAFKLAVACEKQRGSMPVTFEVTRLRGLIISFE